MAVASDAEIHIHTDADTLSHAAAERVVAICTQAVSKRGACHLALAGGSTPRPLYQLLAAPPCSEQLAWEAVHVYFGDERAVPPEHSDSNYRMARDTLLSQVPIPAAQCHRMRARPHHLEQDAADYAALLQRNLPRNAAGVPRFDLILLGMGSDGHIASLFPGTAILDEAQRWVAAVRKPDSDSWRLSLTYPVLNAARHLLFLVAGGDKAGCVRRALSPAPPIDALPVQRISPEGKLEWYLDRAAARELESSEA